MNGPKTTFTAAPEFAFNPMAGNPFATRADAVRALKGLSAPLMGYFSEGKGRLRLGSAGAHFHEAAADLEGLARPLWGLAPLVIVEADLDYLEKLAMDDGWYRDGPGRRAEHYIPFAMHFYGLIYAASSERHGPDDAERAERFRQRAPDFAPQIRDWYADDGAALPYGRSLTYRFAHAGFWGALALADVEALPWGEIRGYWARNLRYWASLPIADRDGVLPVGYGYPNLLVSESYNSPGSPYWAFKAFAPLAVPESHPFWQAEEAPYSPRAGVTALKQPGMVRWEEPGNVSVLVAGQEALPMRQGPEKYSKFAYSTRYGFSVENDSRTFANGPLDNMLAFSEDGRHAFVRESEADARIGEDYLYSAWSPMAGVTVESWILARPPWHLRIHRVVSARKVSTVEGGFSIRRTDAPPVRGLPQMPAARLADAPPPDAAFRRGEVATEEDLSIIVDLGPTPRGARVLQAQPNTNVIFPRSWVPQLLAQLEPSTTLLASAICARTVALGDPGEPLALPSEDDLQRMKAEAPRVPVWDV